ncbi:MAG: aerobic carbon-monoxide dehydrogenase large subunit, partial [Acetobacteraceae bacterium]|nr:aerobic carbon-monoxide dehydrogenase large subunit [Acetobacteraceae bacterium]
MSSQDPTTNDGPIGRPLLRREDRRFLTGTARYIDDLAVAGAMHARFVRSPHGHARIRAIDTEAASAMPGVVQIATGQDLAQWTRPLRLAPAIEGLHPVTIETLPTGKVRFHGDPVACVVAIDRAAADDAAEQVVVDYEPLPAVTDIAQAMAQGAPLLDETLPNNLVSHQSFSAGAPDAAFAAAHRVVEARFVQHRQTHVPMEPRGCCAIWDTGREHLTMHVGTQVPHPYRTQLAARLGLSESQVTVICPDIGGGFGQKITLYREELTIAALARVSGRPVRWREERGENLLAAAQAREQTARVRAAVDANGAIKALALELVEDFGAYCFYPANYLLKMVLTSLTGPYRITDCSVDLRVVLTNKCGAAPMRAPMSIASWVMDGTLEAIARALSLDPIAVRRRNMLTAAELPWTMLAGPVLEDVTPRETL